MAGTSRAEAATGGWAGDKGNLRPSLGETSGTNAPSPGAPAAASVNPRLDQLADGFGGREAILHELSGYFGAVADGGDCAFLDAGAHVATSDTTCRFGIVPHHLVENLHG